jgi:hypothetical protein
MAGNPNPGAPIVFISSTVVDLRKYREAAAEAARTAGFLAVLSEDWAAKDHPRLEECLEQVDRAHLTIAIATHPILARDRDNC